MLLLSVRMKEPKALHSPVQLLSFASIVCTKNFFPILSSVLSNGVRQALDLIKMNDFIVIIISILK